MHTISEVISVIEQIAPLQYQEDYDNSGLQIGNRLVPITGVLLSLDVDERVIDEAINLGANLIICHHPVIFKGIRSITGRNSIEKTIIKAIQNNIAIYVCHTSIDNNSQGVSFVMAQKLNLQNIKPLITQSGQLFKLVTFIPENHLEKVRKAVFEAGAGHIGNYDFCSFSGIGEGSFRALDNTQPFVGVKGEMHFEPEVRFETIFPKHLERMVISALISNHPYEEVAYDIIQLNNQNPSTGAGAIGELIFPEEENVFFQKLKDAFGTSVIRHSKFLGKPIKKIAVCGGSGYSFLNAAKASNADVLVTADIKYHQFSEAEENLIIADIGHYESEQYIMDFFYDILLKNFSKFAVYFTKVNTNPINYF